MSEKELDKSKDVWTMSDEEFKAVDVDEQDRLLVIMNKEHDEYASQVMANVFKVLSDEGGETVDWKRGLPGQLGGGLGDEDDDNDDYDDDEEEEIDEEECEDEEVGEKDGSDSENPADAKEKDEKLQNEQSKENE